MISLLWSQERIIDSFVPLKENLRFQNFSIASYLGPRELFKVEFVGLLMNFHPDSVTVFLTSQVGLHRSNAIFKRIWVCDQHYELKQYHMSLRINVKLNQHGIFIMHFRLLCVVPNQFLLDEAMVFTQELRLYSLVAKYSKCRNNYSPKCWKVLFSKLRFIEIFISSSKVRASAEILRMNRRLEIVLSNTLGK